MLIGLTHWDGYTVFSVISGVLLVLMALVPGEKPGTRVGFFLGGIAMGAYGIYVANQTSGTYYFPVYVFLVPIIAVAYFIKNLAGSNGRTNPSGRSISNQSPGPAGRVQPTRPSVQGSRLPAGPPQPLPPAPRSERQNVAAPIPPLSPSPRPGSSPRKIVIDVSDLGDE
jgi:hypothetical protein